jgi:hypothetical protein
MFENDTGIHVELESHLSKCKSTSIFALSVYAGLNSACKCCPAVHSVKRVAENIVLDRGYCQLLARQRKRSIFSKYMSSAVVDDQHYDQSSFEILFWLRMESGIDQSLAERFPNPCGKQTNYIYTFSKSILIQFT